MHTCKKISPKNGEPQRYSWGTQKKKKKKDVRHSFLSPIHPWVLSGHCLIDLVVKASASRVADLEFDSCLCCGDFSGSSHTSELIIGTVVASLPGAWHCRVSIGTGWPGVSILWLGDVESLNCNFYLSVAACTIVWADTYWRYTSMLLGR